MTQPADRHDGLLHELSETGCWERLASGVAVGRVAYTDSDGPVVLPLNYRAEDGAVWLRTASYKQLGVHLSGQRVAFEVDHVDAHDHTGWSVLVRGTAEHVLHTRSTPTDERFDPTPWPDGVRSMVFRVVPTSITGRVLRQGDVTPSGGRGPGTVQRAVVDTERR